MNLKTLISDKVKAALNQQGLDVSIDIPEKKFGDYSTNVALVLSKQVNKPPMDVAENLAGELSQDKELSHIFRKIEAVEPGFVNFYLSPESLANSINIINKNPDKYGSSEKGKGKLVLVEYFQLNAAKPPHVGHLRSAVIGDSLKRLFISQGYKTVSDTHIGDWGTQFGILLWAYKNLKGREKVKDNPLQELNSLYVEANNLIEENEELREQAKKEFVKLEAGDKENKKLWEFFLSVTEKEIKKTVKDLELLPFDYHLGESFYTEKMQEILEKLEANGLLQTGETGERYIDLEQWNLGRLICVKSDGATTYGLRDLAALAYRYEELVKKEKTPLAHNVYVVDNRQSRHLDQVFKAMELLGYDISKSVHTDFGFMSLPEGAISTRKGNFIELGHLLEEAKSRALAIIKEKNPDLKDKEKVAHVVGLGAIKYGDLKHNRKSDIVFRWEEALSFEGNTGPYLQYTYARLRSILRRSNAKVKPIQNITDEASINLARNLGHFPEIVLASTTEFMPSILAGYLYNLSTAANNFYHQVPVLQEENKDLQHERLALVTATSAVLRNGLYLLGIEAPEAM